ncbi:spermidine synthase [Actinacidiphila bryophytorum]|jgi:spermidine synthase|uniref:Spermine/spermidine synthase n=1 Tax=Actinacidiphila bryophytorum TaxID=1436133 RepID=A0A9W4GYU7_9ACTN|nr:fused MFS/spermidine synthase [Actinacidiphila bryophytorum]MBM9434348.1 fused MFS/spermidine synthase [Actinacidiphila bryophytorum]MBN6547904.1 fused MFS/spermidine synthase [Actinacidiphila bryophytorum]UWE08305.1 fused MFS/spermidine synthase [Actinacidiphila bryophytorum]CAG7625042.1 Spermine/spermidine synthase [Actinacidiphila bryophytorum]
MAGKRQRGGRARTPDAVTAQVAGGAAALVPDRERPKAWALVVEGAPQSHVDLAEPDHLGFSYQRRLGHVIDLVAPPGMPLRVLHLGGGALTLARYTAYTRPRSTQQVIELDSALVDLVRTHLPWDRGWRIKVRSGDARAGLAKLPDGWADLVIADVFGGARTPAHLTSAEFLTDVRRVLRPGGDYAANLTDGGALTFLRAQVATVRAAFAEVCLAADPAVLRGKRFGNAVLWAADHDLPVADLTRRVATDPHPGRVDHGHALSSFAAGAPVTTDATATPSPPPPPHAFG